MADNNNGKSKRDLARDAFLEDADSQRRVVAVRVPGIKRTYHIRTVTAAERGRIERNQLTKDDPPQINADMAYAAVVQGCLCDEDGTLLFTEKELGLVAGKPAHFLKPIYEEACKLNKFRGSDVEEAEKNSAATEEDSSSSALPATSA